MKRPKPRAGDDYHTDLHMVNFRKRGVRSLDITIMALSLHLGSCFINNLRVTQAKCAQPGHRIFCRVPFPDFAPQFRRPRFSAEYFFAPFLIARPKNGNKSRDKGVENCGDIHACAIRPLATWLSSSYIISYTRFIVPFTHKSWANFGTKLLKSQKS